MNNTLVSQQSIPPDSIRQKGLVGLVLAVAFVCTVFNVLPAPVLGLICLFAITMHLYRMWLLESATLKLFILWWFVVITGLAIGLYRPGGFNYPMLFSVPSLHDGGAPFSQYLNIGKLLAGILVAVCFLPIVIKGHKVIIAPKYQLATVVVMVSVILGLAIGLLNLEFFVKPWRYILIFGLVNLFATCLSEEAFMRLIFQSEISRLAQRYSTSTWVYEGIPLLMTTFLFIATHYTPTWKITLIYAVAGFCYGLIYALTKSLLLAIGLHFLVNILHFAFLTYPLTI